MPFDPNTSAATLKTILPLGHPPTTVGEAMIITPDDNGNTPLMLAIDSKLMGIVSCMFQFLEDKGSDVPLLLEHRNILQHNAFHLAAINMLRLGDTSFFMDCLNEVQNSGQRCVWK